MTDKEIIIDGVNVSECGFLWKEITNNMCQSFKEADSECLYNPNCYFKQRKRKEQECEEYKQALDEIENILLTDDSGDYDFVQWKILNLIREVKGVN